MRCPKCNSENVVMVGELAHCQSCEYYYKPAVIDEALPGSVSKAEFMRDREIKNRAEKIRSYAFSLTLLAVLFCLIGLAALIIPVLDGARLAGLPAFGICMGVALGFYGVAQLVHIRANTEK
jgi:hypothetical protein